MAFTTTWLTDWPPIVASNSGRGATFTFNTFFFVVMLLLSVDGLVANLRAKCEDSRNFIVADPQWYMIARVYKYFIREKDLERDRKTETISPKEIFPKFFEYLLPRSLSRKFQIKKMSKVNFVLVCNVKD